MNIAAIMVAHDNPALVVDTLESVRHYMTPQVIAVIDGASDVFTQMRTPARLSGHKVELYTGKQDKFRDVKLPAYRLDGMRHGYARAPYRNMVFGLQMASNRWNADWYCYIEPDCLVGNDNFKKTLAEADERGFWCLGNDLRYGNLKFPLLDKLVGNRLVGSAYMLGCCTFISRNLIDELRRLQFFDRFLGATNDFLDGFFPGNSEQNVYDFGEYLWPTLATNLGGKAGELAAWSPTENKWIKRWQQYPMRFRPDLDAEIDGCYEACIMHPIKEFLHPVRVYHRAKREKVEGRSCEITHEVA